MKKPIRIALQILLPLIVIAAGAGIAYVLISQRQQPESTAPEPALPLVDVVRAEAFDIELEVHAQGTVMPRSQGPLISEVAGRVTMVAPSLVNGGFFETDEPLLEIDPVDYIVAVEEARGRVAMAALRLEQEQADARLARRGAGSARQGPTRRRALHGTRPVSGPRTLRARRRRSMGQPRRGAGARVRDRLGGGAPAAA